MNAGDSPRPVLLLPRSRSSQWSYYFTRDLQGYLTMFMSLDQPSSLAALFLVLWVLLYSNGPIILANASPPAPLVRPAGRINPSDEDLCKKLGIHCVHGTCVNDSTPYCQCDQGWKGAACDTCGGRMVLTDSRGYITDGDKNYTTDTKCTWLLEAPSADQTIRLRFLHFATECTWDHLYIYNGSSLADPQLAAYSGLVVLDSSHMDEMPEISVKGHVILHFYSDAAYNMSGFNISYVMGPSCPLDCSGHGDCTDDGRCVCDSQWHGDGCQYELCPNNCSFPNGICDSDGCHCFEGRGDDCGIAETSGYWQLLQPQLPLSPRASHKHVIESEYLYIFFGYNFNHHPKESSVTRLNLKTLQHETILPLKLQLDKSQPAARYGHSVSLVNRTVLMYGGLLLDSGTVTDELWEYSLAEHTWKRLIGANTPSFAVVGHTTHIIRGQMFVFFGHNPTFGYLNYVQMYDISSRKWKLVEDKGVPVNGGYGHSSVYDPVRDLVYVHAGYVSVSYSVYTLTDTLYVFEPKTFTWSMKTGSGHPRFLHSAVFLNQMMIVFGGNTHNDTSISQGAKCYSSDLMVYDPECDTWYTLEPPNLKISRFGHIAETYDDKMYVFGGFDGRVLSDLYKYTPAACESFKTGSSCLHNNAGVLCAWADDKRCVSLPEASRLLNYKHIQHREVRNCQQVSIEEAKAQCKKYSQCSKCVDSRYNCNWCENSCLHISEICEGKPIIRDMSQCVETRCPDIHNCKACNMNSNCMWLYQTNNCANRTLGHNDAKDDLTCNKPCHLYTTCDNCTANTCMWCGNLRQCVESVSYVASFPYGQCMEWTTYKKKCPDTYCAGLPNCHTCLNSPSCGWCDDGTDTGLGQCIDGGLEGPLSDTKTCPAQYWHFRSCPACQCNGHSQCYNGTDICIECQDHTTGDRCQTCKEGYYGIPKDGGNCSMCECNGQADKCHSETGKCYCHTRGVKGDKCDHCDEQNKYYGDPRNGGTCYYDLNTNYKFTFNLSQDKEESKYQTHINFKNQPPEPDRDVDFSINCSGKALMNITIKSKDSDDETALFTNKPCTLFEEHFSHKEYTFGGDSNTTFYVYVYDFKTPFIVEISFLQIDPIDLIHFFITFFSCFLSLLLIAAVVWKVKQRCDLYRRRQRMVVEMEQMASRPFATCNVDLPSTTEEALLRQETISNNTNNIRSSQRYKKVLQSHYFPSPITLEPLSGNKAAVLSLLVRLPTGDEEFSPPGQQGLAVGSALVTIGNHRKNSSDYQRPDKNVKPRKQACPDIPDNCV